MKRFLRKLIYLLLYVLSYALFKLFFNFKVYGKKNELRKGPMIIVSNHLSWFDFLIMAISLKPDKYIHFLAKEEVFKGILKNFLYFMEILPVRRGKLDRKLIKQGLYYLSIGENLGIFPESTRSPDGKLHEESFHDGASYFSIKAGVPILPVLIKGSFEAFPKHRKLPSFFKKIRTKIYPPIYPDRYMKMEFNKETLSLYTDELKRVFREGLEESW